MLVWGTPILADVEEIVERVRYELNKQGINLLRDIKPVANNIMVTCISHSGGQEKNPSLGISTIDQKNYEGKIIPAGTCHCFTCGYSADLPTFISNAFGYDDQGMFGYKWLMRNYVTIEVDERPKLSVDMRRNVTQNNENLQEISEEQLKQYRYIHPYMKQRKLTDKVINYFDVGYDHKTNSLTFPVHDLDGKVYLIQRRSVEGKRFHNDEGVSKGNYLYGLYQVYNNLSWIKELYVTESPIDALTLWGYRIPAVATMGARVTKKQLQLLKEVPIRKIVLAMDNDKAGHEASKYIRDNIKGYKIVYRLVFPEGVGDINEMSQEQIESRKIVLY